VSALSISVVICTRNRPASLERCVASVCAQSRVPEEIIVVDDGELPPETLQRLTRQAEGAGTRWQYVRKTDPGLTRSRNLALDRARGQIVQFFDDDAEPDPDYLAQIADAFAADVNGAIAVLGGRLTEPALMGLGGRTWALASRTAGWWALGRRRMRRNGWPHELLEAGGVLPTLTVSGAALAVRRSVAYPPGFDESLTGYALGEDREIACRLSRTHLVGVVTRAHAVHHWEPSGRLDASEFGRATVENYCKILTKHVPMGVGEWVAVLWSFLVLAGLRIAFALTGNPRRHLLELIGMIRGCMGWARYRLSQAGYCW
jgi:glucosyl-dolichyl phosphate glucuronosyltransferase